MKALVRVPMLLSIQTVLYSFTHSAQDGRVVGLIRRVNMRRARQASGAPAWLCPHGSELPSILFSRVCPLPTPTMGWRLRESRGATEQRASLLLTTDTTHSLQLSFQNKSFRLLSAQSCHFPKGSEFRQSPGFPGEDPTDEQGGEVNSPGHRVT